MKEPRHKINFLSLEEEKKIRDELREKIIAINRDQDKITGSNFTNICLPECIDGWVEREFRIRTTTKCLFCKEGYKEFQEQMCRDCWEKSSFWGDNQMNNASKEQKAMWINLKRKWEGKKFTDKQSRDLIKDWRLDI